jgi:hypothetical protein
MTVHRPERDWNCSECRVPWPCDISKPEIVARFDGAIGAILAEMTAQYHQAAVVLTDTPSTDLYIRFAKWIPGPDSEPWPFHAVAPKADR